MGAALHCEVAGDAGGRRVVLVHGFTQTGRSWEAVAEALAPRRQVVVVDLPGHGRSAGVRLAFPEAAAAIGGTGGRAAYVGYSLGGRLCLRLALDHPHLVTSLVLVSASPGIADPEARAERRAADERLASTIEADGTGAFLDRWLAQPLFAGLRPPPGDLAGRRANAPSGLAAALRLLGTGSQEPLWDRLPGLSVPTLAVAGEDDARFADVARRMAAAVPGGPGAPGTAASVPGTGGGGGMELVLVPGAGHAVHLQAPQRLAAVVDAFLDRHQAE